MNDSKTTTLSILEFIGFTFLNLMPTAKGLRVLNKSKGHSITFDIDNFTISSNIELDLFKVSDDWGHEYQFTDLQETLNFVQELTGIKLF